MLPALPVFVSASGRAATGACNAVSGAPPAMTSVAALVAGDARRDDRGHGARAPRGTEAAENGYLMSQIAAAPPERPFVDRTS